MASYKQVELVNLGPRRLAEFAGCVVHGTDPIANRNFARDICARLNAAGSAPLRVSRFTGAALVNDPALLATEVFSMSLLGEQEIVEVSDVGEEILSQLQTIVAQPGRGNFVLVLCGALSKSSKLRGFAETSDKLACVALYEQTRAQIADRISGILQQHKMVFAAGAQERFMELIAGDFKSADAELDKLLLYCLGAATIEVEDVVAICGDTSSFATDDIIDGAMSGDLARADQGFSQIESTARGGFLPQLIGHINRLISLRMEMARGMSADGAFRAAKPPLFFGRREHFLLQLRLWDLPSLAQALAVVTEAMAQSRKMNALESAILSRCVISLARMAKSQRAKLN